LFYAVAPTAVAVPPAVQVAEVHAGVADETPPREMRAQIAAAGLDGLIGVNGVGSRRPGCAPDTDVHVATGFTVCRHACVEKYEGRRTFRSRHWLA